MDWELVEQLSIQAPVVLGRCSKRWFFENPYKVTIRERSECKVGTHELTKQGLIHGWLQNQKSVEPRHGNRVSDTKWSAISKFMPPFFRLRLL